MSVSVTGPSEAVDSSVVNHGNVYLAVGWLVWW